MDVNEILELKNEISQLSKDIRDLTKLLRDDVLDSLMRIEKKLDKKHT